MAPFKKSTTQLPSALREELGLPEVKSRSSHPYSQSSRPSRGGRGGGRGGFNNHKNSHQNRSKPNSVVGRKEARKAARVEKKTKPPLKVIGKGLSAEQHERQKKDGGTAKSYMKSNAIAKGNGKQREADIDEEDDHIYAQMIEEGRQHRKHGEESKNSKKKHTDPSSSSTTPSSNQNSKKRSRDSIEDSKIHNGQRKHVNSDTLTPLEKMLAKAESKSSSKGKGKEVNVRKKARSRMTQQEKDEEDEIRWLEAHLAKEKKGDDMEDDLDGFLEDLNRFQPGMYSDEDEDQEELEDQESQDDSGLEDALLDEDDSEAEDDETDWDAAMQDSDAEMEDANLSEGEDSDENEDSESEQEDETAESSPQSEADKAAPALSDLPSTGKYMPPAARAVAAAAAAAEKSTGSLSAKIESIELQKLRRQAQGQLNRLGENNIESILFALTTLYDTNSRAEVSSTLTSLILETISARADLGNRFVVLYAALVGGLHRIVGVEFGASVVQKVVEKLTAEYKSVRVAQSKVLTDASKQGQSSDQASTILPNGKECVNLLILLSELYNLQIVACPLIYDFIRLFLKGGGEQEGSSEGMVDIDIELLLKVVKSCGQQLRHDDPTSLKSIIALTQESVSKTPLSDHLGSRPRFMLETLNDLKNNRHRKTNKALGDSNGSSSEELTMKMRKWLNGLSKKHSVRNYESLRIGLKDLQEAESKGKWWLVGAAWTGHDDETQSGAHKDVNGMTIARPLIEDIEPTDEGTAQLLKEARRHGMNTDSKRKIFVAIMSAEDYVDAGTRLLQLKLNEVQRRDIIRVLLHCLGQENTYNPYYTLIGTQLSKDSQEVRITMQYSLWDLLRDMGEKQVGGLSKISANEESSDDEDEDEDDEDSQTAIKGPELQKIVNVARAYGWWIAKGCLSLNALKTVNFTSLKPKGKLFLQMLFIHLLLSLQSKSPSSVLSSKLSPPNSSDLESLESVLIRGTIGNQDLSKGIQFFLTTELDGKKLRKLLGRGMDNGTRKRLDWSLKKSAEIVALRSQGLLNEDEDDG